MINGLERVSTLNFKVLRGLQLDEKKRMLKFLPYEINDRKMG